jgi:glucose/arabinose dehydrogenase
MKLASLIKRSVRYIIYPLLAIALLLITIAAVKNFHVKAAVPNGFQKNLVIADGLNLPTKFAFAPDGRIFITEKAGAVRLYQNGQLEAEPLINIPVATDGDLGLLGIALDPNFTTNGYLYLHYTGVDKFTNIGRLKLNGNTLVEGLVILYTTTGPSDRTHTGGGITFGGDGKLYFTFGDSLHRPNSQDLTNSFGKVMRLNSDGSIPHDNPYFGVAGALDEIWAYGLRNPFTMHYDPINDLMLVADVGENTWEEINVIKKGANYGWPGAEGDCGACIYENPLYAYNHDGQTASISLGTVYTGNQLPPDYRNSILFGDYARGFIKSVGLAVHDHGDNHDPVVEEMQDFDLEAGTVVDLQAMPDGSVYFLNVYPGQLFKVQYQPVNPAPIVKINVNTNGGQAPLTVNFNSFGTTDPNGDPLIYAWNFGDGTTSNLQNPTKIYNQNGRYRVQLTVADGDNTSISEPLFIQVGTPPVINVVFPTEGDTYVAGDIINYSTTATDGKGNAIAEGNIDTKIIFHHLTHIHPFMGPFIGQAQGSFDIAAKGETHPVQWYEIEFTAEDTDGLISKKSVNVYPITSVLQINTNPGGLTIFSESQPSLAPYSHELLTGSQIDISTIPNQTQAGKFYQFESWSNGGNLEQAITLPAEGLSLTANFVETQAYFVEYFNNMNLEGGPVVTDQAIAINHNWGMGSPVPEVDVDQFSIRWSKNEYFTGGSYKFTTTSDDGVRVKLDGHVILDAWHDQSSELHEVTIDIPEGEHQIVVEYYENGWFAVMNFGYQKVAGNPDPGDGTFTAQFYNNMNLEGNSVVTRQDNDINFDWGQAKPAPEVNADQFSARWTKNHNFEGGTYEFTTTSDDGIRLYIDGNLVIDQWNDHGATVHSIEVDLTAGIHNIRIEYYENGWDAVAKLYFEKVGDQEPGLEFFTAQYWNNKDLFGNPVLTREEAEVNHDIGQNQISPEVNPDQFSARYVKLEQFTAGNHVFTITSDDGVRLYIDDELVLNNWNDHGRRVDVVNVNLAEGLHEIKVEYYENGWDSVIILNY